MAQDALEPMLREVLDRMPDAVSVCDLDGAVLYANAASQRMFGLDHVRRRLWDQRADAADNPFRAAFLRVAAGGPPEELENCDGERWFASRLERVGDRVHLIGREVTEARRHRAEAGALRQRLADALPALVASQHRAAGRLERLLEVARQLGEATTADEVGRAVIDAGVAALDAAMAGMWLVEGDALVLARSRGFSPDHEVAFARIRHDAPGPIARCVREARPIWVTSRADYAEQFGAYEARYRPEDVLPIAFGAVPIVVEGVTTGVLAYVFHDERRMTEEERAYIQVLASHAASALVRAGLHARLVEALEVRQAMIEASPATIVLLDAETRVHAWNAAAERMFGWSADEVLGRPLPTVPDDARAELRSRLAAITAGATLRDVEAKRTTRDGRTIEVEIHSAPVRRAPGVPLCLSIVADISERKRVERGRELIAEAGAVLARSLDWEQTLAQVVRMPLPSFADWCIVHLLEGDALVRIAKSDGPIVLAEPMVRHDPRRGGASAAIATGQSQVLVDVDDAARSELARDPAQYDRLRSAGMRSYLSAPMRTGGRVIGAFTFGSRTRNFDALDRTIGEGLAVQAAGAIENARLYREATSARAEAEAANRAKDEFLAMLGHELRNPLAPISTAVQLMTVRPPPHEREREVIARQVGHLTRLVDDLLDISRITRGKIQLAKQRTSIEAVAARAVELASPLLEQRGHQLHVDLAPGLHVDGDPTRLAQVLANLLTNAAVYTPAKGRIEVAAHREGDEIVAVVRDNGIGIPPEALPTIFDAFVQGPRSIARTEGGLGLGLAIVRSIVELHGGRVAARSKGPGRGTELEVRLPAATTSAEPPRRSARRIAGPRRRVLIVDDNQDAAELLAELLDASGHEIRTAFDGPGALRVIDEFEPEVALLDLGLPVMDGYELARRLRARCRAVRLIAVTGYGQAADHERSKTAGFDVHLTKPVTFDALVRVLAEPGA